MTYDPNHPATPEPGPTPAPAPTPAPTAWPAAAPTSPVGPTQVTSAPAPVLPATKSKGSSGRVLNVILGVAIAVAIGGVAFAVGRSTAPASAATTGRGGFAANNPNASFIPRASGAPGFGGGGRGGFGGAGLTIRGTVESVDGDTVTIKTATGQTIEVTTGADTTYGTQAPATASDVTEGATVQVQLQVGGGANGGAGALRPGASGAPTGPVGTAGSITVIP